jgi:hypothetical protein
LGSNRAKNFSAPQLGRAHLIGAPTERQERSVLLLTVDMNLSTMREQSLRFRKNVARLSQHLCRGRAETAPHWHIVSMRDKCGEWSRLARASGAVACCTSWRRTGPGTAKGSRSRYGACRNVLGESSDQRDGILGPFNAKSPFGSADDPGGTPASSSALPCRIPLTLRS